MLTAAPVCFPILDPEHTSRAFLDAILENRFQFNGEVHRLADAFDWTHNPSSDIEWLILLHKFYYAPGLGLAYQQTGDSRYLKKWMELTESWIDSAPLDFLTSDVAGRRIQNWIFALHYFDDGRLPPAFRDKFVRSIEAQATRLCGNLTPARNHRTLELFALLLTAVMFPEMDGASGWLAFCRREIPANLKADLRPDGVHCEQSTDYHHIVLRNVLAARRLAKYNGVDMGPEFDERIRKALEFSLHIHRPDGVIPSLSDGDNASFLPLLELGYELYGDERYRYVASKGASGQAPSETNKAFHDGGYYILRSGWGANEAYGDERYLVFDCGPLGEGNHGHLDLLSFEMYAYGRALVVDPGRYTYDESGDVNWRVLFRGTSHHNTVTVDGRNQTRYEFHKRKFKIRGPEPEYRLTGFGGDFVSGMAASHEYDVVHHREIRLMEGRYFVITDRLQSPSRHQYALHFHLSAAAQGNTTIRHARGRARIDSPHLVMELQQKSGIRCSVEPGWVSQVYGTRQPAPIVKFVSEGANVEFTTLLYPYKDSRPEVLP
ncbi:MAG: alginate lyase family protein [Bryobacteraceae bacterium]|nr:alginate lyase family protein [Bryobacteraceae bacterium]